MHFLVIDHSVRYLYLFLILGIFSFLFFFSEYLEVWTSPVPLKTPYPVKYAEKAGHQMRHTRFSVPKKYFEPPVKVLSIKRKH